MGAVPKTLDARPARRIARLADLRPAIVAGAPNILAVLTAAAGVMLLASGATPSDPVRFMWLAERTPIILIETSHFVSSMLGVVLVMLAFGLSRRLDGAWAATMAVLPIATVLAMFKGFDWEESLALVVLFGLVAPCHGAAFPRSARAVAARDHAGLDVVGVGGHRRCAGLAGWWSFQHLDYANVSVLKVMGDADAEARRSARRPARRRCCWRSGSGGCWPRRRRRA